MTVLNLVSGTLRCYADEISKVPDYTTFLIEPIIPDSMRHLTWFGSAYGLCTLSWDTEVIKCMIPVDGSEEVSVPKNIIDMVVDKKNENVLWLGTANGLFSYDRNDGKYRAYPVPDLPDMVIMDLYVDKDGNIWLGGDAGREKHQGRLFKYIPPSGSFVEYNLSMSGHAHTQIVGEVYDILPASKADELWVSTKSGVGVLNTTSGAFNAWVYDAAHPDGLLPNEFFRSMLADRHGRLWISSWQGIQYAKDAFVGTGKKTFMPKVAITDFQFSNERGEIVKPLLFQDTLDRKSVV